MKRSSSTPAHRGAIAPLTAILLIPLLGMVAFAVDMGWITHTQNELQSAADAAALAGAGQLGAGFVQYYLPGQTGTNQASVLATATTGATTYAKKFASYNSAGGVASLQLLDGDVSFGVTDTAGNYTPLPAGAYPNTVKVTLRRDASANGALAMFFAQVIGVKTVNLTATAAATIYSGSVDSFRTNTSFVSRILPVTYDVNHWNNFLKTGQDPDGNTSVGPDGSPQLAVYPSLKFTGNFGQLSLDQGNDGASTISGWIDNGVSGADLQNEVDAGLLPLSKHDSTLPPDWKGNPGLKTSTIHTAANHVGDLYLLPLFKPVNDGVADPSQYQAGSGNGSHYYYTIVQFVGVTISSADKKSIVVQPSALIDPNALYTSVTPAQPPSGGNTLVTTFTGAKLTQ